MTHCNLMTLHHELHFFKPILHVTLTTGLIGGSAALPCLVGHLVGYISTDMEIGGAFWEISKKTDRG